MDYRQLKASQDRYSGAAVSSPEFSYMEPSWEHITTGFAGDIIPVACFEMLPNQTIELDIGSVIRQTTITSPTMGSMQADFYGFFVPNRIVNSSWTAVMKENIAKAWYPEDIKLAPLYQLGASSTSVQVPVHSVADYYGFPTQVPILDIHLADCHDLKFRGYLSIYDYYFRDENWQSPVPFSTLNVQNGFFLPKGTELVYEVSPPLSTSSSNGSEALGGTVLNQLGINNYTDIGRMNVYNLPSRITAFSALDRPLKANKFHDLFTSVLPSPQKGPDVSIPLSGGSVPVIYKHNTGNVKFDIGGPMWQSTGGNFRFAFTGPTASSGNNSVAPLMMVPDSPGNIYTGIRPSLLPVATPSTQNVEVNGMNLMGSVDIGSLGASVDLTTGNAGVDISDLRSALALQHVYETLARAGSRYEEYLYSFFGVEIDDELKRIPQFLFHFSRDLQLFQTAQTSDNGTNGSLGDLGGFGYTSTGGTMGYPFTSVEHGYVHIFLVVRQKNIYSTYLSQDNFRRSFLDFYQPQLANISEQPLPSRLLNPFSTPSATAVFGYQEAWYSYRYFPSYVSGLMRPGSNGTSNLSSWNYADPFDPSIVVMTSDWLKSNAQEVLDRSLVIQSDKQPQLQIQLAFYLKNNLPMPTYSVPGLDIF